MRRNEEQITKIKVPDLSLVLLIGASGSGKSTFARTHFKSTEIVSSDTCRGMVSDDENSLAASADAFELARFIVAKRLKNGLLTVIDATNVREEDRKEWVKLAREHHVLPVAIVINMSEKLCVQRGEQRTDRNLGRHAIAHQVVALKRSLRRLKLEGFRQIYELRTVEEVAGITGIERQPLHNDKKAETGPFDIIGDIHGCYDELVLLIAKLGYQEQEGYWRHPEGRKLVFLGDLVDRGPATPAVLCLVMTQVKAGLAYCVPGNHDVKLLKWLQGRQVQVRHGLEQSIAQLSGETPAFREDVQAFLDGLISHYVFDHGRLVVAHAGLKEAMQGRGSGAVREFCLYGETTGEIDEFGLPVRYNWAAEYKGAAKVVYGHTPVPTAQWLNRTIDIDTGCVFGGKLTALRYPESELVDVPAKEVHCEPVRPLHVPAGPALSLQQAHDDLLDIANVSGKQFIETRYGQRITVRAEQAVTALEAMSRFAVNPKWLIYLPPTMSPCETSKLDDYLEHPLEAFKYFTGVGVRKVVCEEKHMGSRTIVIVGKHEQVIKDTFGIEGEGIGTVYTRTGRAYFNDKETEQAFLQRLSAALETAGFYEEFRTEWVCFDAELMPWNAKAQTLLEQQYGPVGAAARHSLTAAVAALQEAMHPDAAPLLERYAQRLEHTHQYITAYQQYIWPVNSLEDYKLAPFHIMATEGKVWSDKPHEWHMDRIADICAADSGILQPTSYRIAYLDDPQSLEEVTDWWVALTANGGEGMVVKPYDFVAYNGNSIEQPAIKVRGKEYLRIIYGPDYTMPEHLTRLKARGLSTKRSMALREFLLGLEGLHRFVEKEPLSRVHGCAFGVLALESEAVDPRL
ncbi:polynucleotide kinase-phosphatase [Chitinophaga pendula]|uniref:polynucleotide kinase-phosphatase n=1 Tax=Chitinophaga TaxID=79328 RepID=UPI000BB02AAC|nr:MULTISPECIES: polynucleotide kinase-phosphatase [Chitinophaga]ASZ10189.1 polynucleotide kinase-phosphatase [Chitinophaga sp. MD30]UCJ06856.1 polynucleotide kinase-phosphatase [Chitinophaga pendula]